MADQDHVRVIKEGALAWNKWREDASLVHPELSAVDLSRANLSGANLSGANLGRANLRGANLRKSDLSGAKLIGAKLVDANLSEARITDANLTGADLSHADIRNADLHNVNLRWAKLHKARLNGAHLKTANLSAANLSQADLTDANLRSALLIETNFSQAKLTGCKVYGISAWNINLDAADQSDLIITRLEEPTITVDNLEVAQFIYLLLRNDKIRDVIDTITSKVVLILGRFTSERKVVLDAIRDELRRLNYTPVLFDFDKPASKDTTGTVETLARMARFIIADLTDPSSIPHELATVVPFLRTTPVQTLRLAGSGGYSMFDDFERAYPWVLKSHEYQNTSELISVLPKIIAPADLMVAKLRNA